MLQLEPPAPILFRDPSLQILGQHLDVFCFFFFLVFWLCSHFYWGSAQKQRVSFFRKPVNRKSRDAPEVLQPEPPGDPGAQLLPEQRAASARAEPLGPRAQRGPRGPRSRGETKGPPFKRPLQDLFKGKNKNGEKPRENQKNNIF